jgi:hypothetical protein
MKLDDETWDVVCMEKDCNNHARYKIHKRIGSFIFVISMCEYHYDELLEFYTLDWRNCLK